MKRQIALLLVIAMLLSYLPGFPVEAYAEEALPEAEAEQTEMTTETTQEPSEEEPAEESIPEESTEATVPEESTEATVPEESTEVTVPEEETDPQEPTEDPDQQQSKLRATSASVAYSGTLGTNLNWELYSDGTLFVYGIGEMTNISSSSSAPWYKHRANITSVAICEGVTSVDKNAFYSYTNLQLVVLTSTVTTLEDRAFYGCTGLVGIDLGGVTKVPERAFYGCTSLQYIQGGNGLTSIDQYAFVNTALTSLTIPDSVTFIGERAFSNCDSLQTLTLGNGLVQSGYEAFYGCDNLKEVTFGSGLKDISISSFSGCKSLKTVRFPDTLQQIFANAFKNCTALTDVYIGSGITSIASEAFSNCSGIRNVWYRGTKDQWADLGVYGTSSYQNGYLLDASRHYLAGTHGDNISWNISFDGVLTVSGSGAMAEIGKQPSWCDDGDVKAFIKKVVVAEGVTALNEGAFFDLHKMQQVSLPETLITIGYGAFENCESLQSVTLPASLEVLGEGVFQKCSALKEITVHEGNPNFYTDSRGVVYNHDGVLVSVPGGISGSYEIAEGTEIIAGFAFSACEKLTAITIPDSVKKIGQYAFYRCGGLTSVQIPDSVQQMDEGAFYWCYGLTSLRIPRGITRLETSVFGECYALTEIVIPDNITYIGNSAFWNCFNVKAVSIANGVTEIDGYAFSWLQALETITIPDSVKRLGEGAFDGCEALTTVNLGRGLSVVEARTFNDCGNLQEVYIPKQIDTIAADAFLGCGSLHTIWYDGVEAEWKIMNIADSGNGILGNANVRYIDGRGGCGAGLSWVLEKNGTLSISGTGAIDSAPWAAEKARITTVNVEHGVTSLCEAAFADHTALTAISLPDSVNTLGEGVFSGCTGLKEVSLSSEITGIPAAAFADCVGLTRMTLPEKVTAIGAGAFGGCIGLTEIVIGASVAEIAEDAFHGCSALNSIAVAEENTAYTCDGYGVLFNADMTRLLLAPAGLTGSYIVPLTVEEIAANAFPTEGLTAVVIPASVAVIGDNAFAGCTKLKNVRYHADRTQWEAISMGSGNDRLLNAKIAFTEAAGACGEELVWELETGGLLTISGTGAMADFDSNNPAPWAEFAETIRTLKFDGAVAAVGSYAFDGCTGLTSVVLPDSIVSVGEGAFRSCSALRELTIGNGVTVLGANALSGCTGLKTVRVGSGLEVNVDTFAGCTALEAIHVSAENNSCRSIDGLVYSADGTCLIAVPMGRTEAVVLPDGVTAIGAEAFAGSRVSAVTLPAGVQTIGYRAFADAGVKSVNIPDSVTEIGAMAFANTRLQAVLLPAGVTAVGEGAFAGCTQLTSIAIPAGLTAVAADTFRDCTALNTVTIPASIAAIGENAFLNCAGLTVVNWLGTAEEFANVTIAGGNEALTAAQIIMDQAVSVVAAPNAATGKPEIRWDAVEGVSKYEIHRATAIDGKYKKVKTVSATTYADTSASVGGTYYYKIKAVQGKTAVEIGTAISRCVCAQPKVKTTINTTTAQLTISWGGVSGASKYTVLRAESVDGAYTELVTQKGTKFVDKTAQPDTVYYYQILVIPTKAGNECVEAAPIRVVVPIAKPVIKTGTYANGKPLIYCAELPGADEYILYRTTTKKGAYTQIMVSDVPSFVDDTAEVGKTYYYKMKAAGVNGESIDSAQVSVLCCVSSPVITATRSNETGKASLRWRAVPGAAKYEVYRSTKETKGYAKVATTTALTWQDVKATPGATYYYKVHTVPSNTKAKSVSSNICSVFALCAQPTLTVKYDAMGQHTISWAKVTGAKTYELWRADSADGEFVLLVSQKGTSYVDKNTQPDTRYYYKVNVLSSKAGANSMDMTPQAISRAIAQPKITKGNNSSGDPLITWSAVEGAVRYKVYRSTSSKGTYALVSTVQGTSFADRNTQAGSRYYYKITALGNYSESAASNVVDVYKVLPSPVITSGEQDLASGKPVIYWKSVEGAKKYDVYRADSENGKYKKINSGLTVMSYTDTSATNTVTYYYKVMAVGTSSKMNSALGEACRVTCGNISAYNAEVRAILLKMERYPNYLSFEAETLLINCDLYDMAGTTKYFEWVCDDVVKVTEYISKIHSSCGSHSLLKNLKKQCYDALQDHLDPDHYSSSKAFVRAARSYAKDAQRIVSNYNAIRSAVGLEKIGSGYN